MKKHLDIGDEKWELVICKILRIELPESPVTKENTSIFVDLSSEEEEQNVQDEEADTEQKSKEHPIEPDGLPEGNRTMQDEEKRIVQTSKEQHDLPGDDSEKQHKREEPDAIE